MLKRIENLQLSPVGIESVGEKNHLMKRHYHDLTMDVSMDEQILPTKGSKFNLKPLSKTKEGLCVNLVPKSAN